MASPAHYLALAAAYAVGGPARTYLLGALAVRGDGAVVLARNGPTVRPCPAAHAERRVLRKADNGSTVYVARVTRLGTWAMARPCQHCERALRTRGVRAVVFTTGPNSYSEMSLL